MAAILGLVIDPARALAAPTFDLQSVGIETGPVTADTLLLGDYAKITMSSDGTAFSDVGYLPAEGFSLAGNRVSPAGFAAPGESGWGLYLQYSGTGTQTFSASGIPEAATYAQLSYQVVGYEGSTTFGFDAAGDPVTGGTALHSVVLGQGSLINGMLSFVPTSPTSLSIEGDVSATFTSAIPQLEMLNPAMLMLTINHPPSDYGFTSASTIQIASASGATATLDPFLTGTGSGEQGDPPDPSDPPAPVPEPASTLVVGAALLGLGVGRAQLRHRSARAS